MHSIVRAALTLTMASAASVALAQSGSGGNAAPFTEDQAKQGHDVYTQHCASCHGDKLQGLAAPSLAGKDFLSTAEHNGWTMGMLQTIVTQNMPFNDPASLSDEQYANVIAYLLASNCFPASGKKFPEESTPALARIKIATPSHPSGTPDAGGVCAVN
ncbi:MAG TPA: cytochrome c [Paraburkholderia sp.]|jgi:polar amino acid transport system substrate-binding protein|nr:cytochrome c [Paraburkholderia sp.]